MSPELDWTPWDCGWSAGFTGHVLHEFVAAVERELGRILTADELRRVADGFVEGRRDAESYRRDMEARKDVPVDWSEVPF